MFEKRCRCFVVDAWWFDKCIHRILCFCFLVCLEKRCFPELESTRPPVVGKEVGPLVPRRLEPDIELGAWQIHGQPVPRQAVLKVPVRPDNDVGGDPLPDQGADHGRTLRAANGHPHWRVLLYGRDSAAVKIWVRVATVRKENTSTGKLNAWERAGAAAAARRKAGFGGCPVPGLGSTHARTRIRGHAGCRVSDTAATSRGPARQSTVSAQPER